MKIKVLIGVLVALIVLNLATIGSFVYMSWRGDRSDRPDWGGRGWRDRPGVAEAPEQRPSQGEPEPTFRPPEEARKQLRALLNEFREETEEIRRQIYEDENLVFELMGRDSVPRARVDSLLGEISDNRLDMRRKAVDKLVESKTYLSPRQQQRFFESILGTRSDRGIGRGWHDRDHPRGERSHRRRQEADNRI